MMMDETTEETEACVQVMVKLMRDPRVTKTLDELGIPDYKHHLTYTLLAYVYFTGHAESSMERLRELSAIIPVKH